MYNFSNISTLYLSGASGQDDRMGFLDHEDGFGNGPVKTLERALEQVAELRRACIQQPITLKIMDDELFLSETVVIDEKVCALTIEPYDMLKRTTVTGSRKLTGFYGTEFNGHKCFAVHIPEVKEKGWSFGDLYVDGIRAELPRYPETGYLVPSDVEIKTRGLHDGSKWFIAKEGDLDSIENVEDCQLVFRHFWVVEYTPIERFDRDQNKVYMAYRSGYDVFSEDPEQASTMEYYLENVPEKFGKPNQWYLDKAEGILYYVPRDSGQTPENIQVYAPMISMLFDVHGDSQAGKKVNNIRFRNIDFRYTGGDYYSGNLPGPEPKATDGQSSHRAPGTIRFLGAHSCFLEHCSVRNYGHYGVSIEDGCDNIHVQNNVFYDGGAGGIKINGAGAEGEECQQTRGNMIADNEISFCGRKFFSGCGVLLMNAYENTVAHNTIHDLYYSGISVGWVWGYAPSVSHDNLIEKNHIYNLGNGLLSDMGGIYMLGKQPGTIVRGNLIHDVTAKHYGGWGIYTDEGASFITIENNICYNFSENGYHQHYGSMNTVRNNIFAFARDGMLRVSKPEMHLSILFERNIVVSDGAPMYEAGFGKLFNQNFSASKNTFFDYGNDTTYFLDRNGEKETLETFQRNHDRDWDSIVADPLFLDVKKYDFTLSQDSPARQQGFIPFDLSDAGVRKG